MSQQWPNPLCHDTSPRTTAFTFLYTPVPLNRFQAMTCINPLRRKALHVTYLPLFFEKEEGGTYIFKDFSQQTRKLKFESFNFFSCVKNFLGHNSCHLSSDLKVNVFLQHLTFHRMCSPFSQRVKVQNIGIAFICYPINCHSLCMFGVCYTLRKKRRNAGR